MSRPRVMVVRGDSLSSRAIEGFGGGWPSHMANLLADGSFWDARDDLITFDHTTYPRGVQHRPAGYLQTENKQWSVFQAPAGTEKHYHAWVEALESQKGKPYDSVGIWDFARGMVTGKYEDWDYAPEEPASSKAWFCDEYATWAAGKLGLIPWPIPVEIFTLTPGSALNLFIGAGWEFTAGSKR